MLFNNFFFIFICFLLLSQNKMPSKMNKMIKKIKNMKIFKNKKKSYEKDIQEDMVFTTSFGTKERIESMNYVDVNNTNVEEKAFVGLDSVKTSDMNYVDVNNMNVDGLKEKVSVGFDSVKTSAMNSVDVNNINVNDIKSNAIVLNKKIDSSEHEFIREKSLSMDYGLKEIDFVEENEMKRALSMDSMDFNGINVNKEEWYDSRLESIEEERECKSFEWFKECLH